ncbi:MAG: DEAD/DEAH box helicase [Hyphomicrobium sp.]
MGVGIRYPAAIPVAVTGRDVLGIAQTGTGKTASFVLPMITRLETGRARARMPRSLILAPTRELAAQVEQSFVKYGVNHKLDVALLIGGVSMDEQVKKLDRGVDVLIATPGRLLDHFGRGRIMLMGVEILVIDEADRMLDMGFIPDIEKICKLLPPRRQTLFFSATMPAEITRLVSQFLKDPVRIEAAKPATTAKTITQRFRYCPDGEDYAKREVLRELIKNGNVKNAIIFCNRKRDVAVLYKSLAKHGFNAGALHGDMEQSARTQTLDKFRAGEIMLLAASDVAARGLDIPDVSHVFNFDLPWAPDDYVHRIGRTGRAGKEGYAASLVSPEDLKSLKDIEKMLGEPVEWLGEGPSEEDYASGGKRRRGGRFGSAGAAPERGGRDRGRDGERGGERGRNSRGGDRPPRAGGRERPAGEPRAERAPATDPTAQTVLPAERPRRQSWPDPRRADGAPEARPDMNPETRSEPRSEATSKPRDVPRSDPRPGPQNGPQSGPKNEQSSEPRQDNRGETRREPRREPQGEGRRPEAREGGRPQQSSRPPRADQRNEPRGNREPREQREPRPDMREPRENQEPRAQRNEPRHPSGQPPGEARGDARGQRPPREKRPDSWADTPAKGEREARKPAPRSQEPKNAPQQDGRTGFAENIPAFLRKPPRPLKQPGGR